MAMKTSAGSYWARISSQKLTQAKTGTLQIAYGIEVLGKVNPQDPENLESEGAGLQRTIFRPVTDNTAEYVWRELDALGFTGDDFAQLDPEHAAAAGKEFCDLSGKDVRVRCTPNVFNGQENERWEFDMMGGGMQLSSADGKAVREATARFGRKPQAGAAPSRPAAGSSRPAPSGNKIPF